MKRENKEKKKQAFNIRTFIIFYHLQKKKKKTFFIFSNPGNRHIYIAIYNI